MRRDEIKEIRYLLIDLDDTILDFEKTESVALKAAFSTYGVTLTEEDVAKYNEINIGYWKRLEKKELDKEALKQGRFEDFLATLSMKITVPISRINEDYMWQLGCYVFPVEGAEAGIRNLSDRYRLYIVTNGTTSVQKRRLEKLSIGTCFEGMFISDEVGVSKPDAKFYERVFEQIGDSDPSHYLIIGDSLSSDIQGGIHAGIATCLFCYRVEKGTGKGKATYEVESWDELSRLLQ